MKKLFAFILGLPLVVGGFVGKSEVKAVFARIFAVRTVETVAPTVMRAAPRAALAVEEAAPMAAQTVARSANPALRVAGSMAGAAATAAAIVPLYRTLTEDNGGVVPYAHAEVADTPPPPQTRSRNVHLADPGKL